MCCKILDKGFFLGINIGRFLLPSRHREEARRREVRSLTNLIVMLSKKMATKLYIGGLSYNTTEDALKDAFSNSGTVTSASIIMDKMTGRSRGFGFVEMSNDEEAKNAIDMWNGKELDGRTLTVNEARPLGERPARRPGGGGGGYGDRGGNGGGFGGGRRDRW